MARLCHAVLAAALCCGSVSAQVNDLLPGDHSRTVAVGDRVRAYHVHVPASYTGKRALPVVLVLHGGGGNGRQMARYSGMSRTADREGFLAVYPDGSGRLKGVLLTWNTGLPGIYATRTKSDDLEFIRSLLDDLETIANVDRRRVYATGISNGAMLSLMLAAHMPDRIAAVAPVAGTVKTGPRPGARPVSVLFFHGTKDRHVPIEGGIGPNSRVRFRFPSVADTVAVWVEASGCPSRPKIEDLPDRGDDRTSVQRHTYGPGREGAEVVLYRIEGGGHTWPGSRQGLAGMLGPTTRDISANEIIWAFFKRHPMAGTQDRKPVPKAKAGARAVRPPFFSVQIPLRDGQALAGDVYLPARDGRWPAILILTPYDRRRYRATGRREPGQSRFFARDRYAWVTVDWRGYYGSEAAQAKTRKAGGEQRGEDGYDAVEWIAKQNWCVGRVGTWGASALGKAQFWAAAKRPPNLACIAPIVAAHGFSYAHHYSGGVLKKAHVERKTKIGFPGVEPLVKAHPTYDAPWRRAERGTGFSRIDLPVLMIGGWYDSDTEGVLDTFHALLTKAGPRAREHLRLLVGPWTHVGATMSRRQQGQLQFPEAEGAAHAAGERFFDYWLREQRDNGWAEQPRVSYFLMGASQWLPAESWPPPALQTRPLYLRADKTLSPDPPGEPAAGSAFRYDPRDPSPTVGGMNLPSGWGDRALADGPMDQRRLVEGRGDCLVFTTAPLDRDLSLIGQATVELHLSSDRKDTDVAVRLCDVYPDGRSMLLTDGIQRMRYREGLSRPAFMAPGEVYPVSVRLVPTAHRFLRGHRIRLVITSSHYPRFARNPNTGQHWFDAESALVATNTVHHDGTLRSALVLVGLP